VNSVTCAIRRATWADQAAIDALVQGERLNPVDLDWRRFIVAENANGVIGAVQLRQHDDDARELGTLVVRKDARGRGIASRLIDAVLASAAGRVLMITGERFAAHYARWGFRRIEPALAPAGVRRNYYFGKVAGWALWLAGSRRPRPLAIFDRRQVTRAQGAM